MFHLQLYLMSRQQHQSGSEDDSPILNREQNNNNNILINEVDAGESTDSVEKETSLAVASVPQQLAVSQLPMTRNSTSADLKHGNRLLRTSNSPTFSSATSVYSGVHMNGAISSRASPCRFGETFRVWGSKISRTIASVCFYLLTPHTHIRYCFEA